MIRLDRDTNEIVLKASGIDIILRINGYTSPKMTNKDEYDCWCDCSLILRSHSNGEHWLNYRVEHKELMLSCEVDSLADRLDRLLAGEFKKQQLMSLIEPDIQFVFHPKQTIKKGDNTSNEEKVVYVRDKVVEVPPQLDFIINFWDNNGALSANYLTITLDEGEIRRLLEHLRFIQS